MKTNKHFNIFYILAIIFAAVFTACSDGQQGNEASIILNLGSSSGNRTTWPHDQDPGILDKLVYKVVIDGPDHIEIESTGKAVIKTTVTPGIYTIKVEAWYLNEQYAKDSVENITIKTGSNIVPISLKPWNEIPEIPDVPDIPEIPEEPAMDPAKTYLIVNGERMEIEFDSLSAALMVAKTDYGEEVDGVELLGLGLKEFTVSIGDGNHSLNNDTGGSIFEDEKVTIEKHGSDGASILLDSVGSLFKVEGTLTLQGKITLNGINDNQSALIVVKKGGILNIYDDVSIKGNKNMDDGDGGGVYVYPEGTFNMHGGKIIDNETLNFGGGVICLGGTFYMDGGIISGNKAGIGGGVHFSGETFNMDGGIITDNTAEKGGGVALYNEGYYIIEDNIYDNHSDNDEDKDVFILSFP